MRLLLAAVACAACASAVEFGLYDHEVSPGGAWRIMSPDDFTKHKEAFVSSYNKLSGIKPIKVFQTKQPINYRYAYQGIMYVYSPCPAALGKLARGPWQVGPWPDHNCPRIRGTLPPR